MKTIHEDPGDTLRAELFMDIIPGSRGANGFPLRKWSYTKIGIFLFLFLMGVGLITVIVMALDSDSSPFRREANDKIQTYPQGKDIS